MARPTKQGIDYFPLDVEWDENTEMFLLEYGANGLAVLITVWQLIYKNEGYFINHSDSLLLMVKKRITLETDVINDCINGGLRWNLFDKFLHKRYKILTSKGIQKRFFAAASKKKRVSYFEPYLLIDVSGYGNLINSDINPINSGENAIKEKEEEKEKEKEKGEGKGNGFPPPDSEKDLFQLWITTWGRNPSIPEQEETQKLILKFGYDKVRYIYREAKLRNFKSLRSLINSLDEQGNIKDKNYGTDKKTYQSRIIEEGGRTTSGEFLYLRSGKS